MPASIIRLRGDTASNWSTANPVLRLREWGVEWKTTVGVGEVNIKIGDGVTSWNNLNYAHVSDITEKIIKTFATITESNPVLTTGETLKTLLGKIKKKFDYLNTIIGNFKAITIAMGNGSTMSAENISAAITALEQYKLTQANIYNGRDSSNTAMAASANTVRQNYADIGNVANLPSGYNNCVAAINGLNSNFVTPYESGGFKLNKFGQVDFQIAVTKDYSGDLTTIAQAPQQCVPVSRKMVVGSALIDGSRIPATFYVETSGAVRVYAATTAKTGVLFVVGGSYSIK